MKLVTLELFLGPSLNQIKYNLTIILVLMKKIKKKNQFLTKMIIRKKKKKLIISVKFIIFN
jgi:hypothetical protein